MSLPLTFVEFVEKAVSSGLDDIFDLQSRKALRATTSRLKAALDATIIGLRTDARGPYSDSFWTCSALPFCEKIEIRCKVDTAGANALFACLTAADLPNLKNLSVNVECRDAAGGLVDLGPLRAAAWAAQLESLSLTFEGFKVNFTVFKYLDLNNCTTLHLKGCYGKNMTALARFLSSERCSNVHTLTLSAIEASPSAFPKLLPSALPSLEKVTVGCSESMSLGVLKALAAATLPALRSAVFRAPSDAMCTALQGSPWMKTVHDLEVNNVRDTGLNALLSGARGGALRTLNVRMPYFNAAFSGADLPNLQKLSIRTFEYTHAPINASSILSSRRLPALEDLKIYGRNVHPGHQMREFELVELEVPAAFADNDVLPALKSLWLCDLQTSLAGAAALGRRLPRLTTFRLGNPQPGERSDVFATMFGAAAGFVGEWALEDLTLGDYNVGLSLGIRPDMRVMHALVHAAPGMTRLRELHVNGTLGAAGAELWAQAAAQGLWPRLKFLLVGNVGWDGVRALEGHMQGFTALEFLEIYADGNGDDEARWYEDEDFPGIQVTVESARDRWIYF